MGKPYSLYQKNNPIFVVGMELFKGHFCENPRVCEDSEFMDCAPKYCPHKAPEHFFHDGCPSCYKHEGVSYISSRPHLKEGL